MRNCEDPATPGLLPGYPGYVVFANPAAAPPSPIITHAWHTDAAVLAFLCELSPSCVGFNSQGKLTTNATVLMPSQGVTFYARSGGQGQSARAEVEAEAGGEGARAPQPLQARAPTPRPPPPPPLSATQRAAAKRRAAEERAQRLR